MVFSTKVSTERILDFQLFSNPINTLIRSNRELTEEQGFLIPDGREVLKTAWPELYNSGNFPEGSAPDSFVLPKVEQPTDDTKIYLIGRVLNSNVISFDDGHASVMNFTNDNLDTNKVLTFDHGIGHLNPIIQVTDNRGNIALPIQVVNTVGSTKVKIGREIEGTWRIVAYG